MRALDQAAEGRGNHSKILVLKISSLTFLFLNGVDNDRAGLKRPGPDCLGGMWALGRSQVRPTNYSGTVKP